MFILSCLIQICRRPSGCPDKDLAAHLMPLRQKQKQKMETLLEGIQRDNRRLESLVKQRRKHLTVTQQQVILSQTRVKQVASYLSFQPHLFIIHAK